MKAQYLIFTLFLVFVFNSSCSSSDNIDEEITVTRGFFVKDKDTNTPISGASVYLDGNLICDYSGCGSSVFGYEETDSDGNSCITISQSQM